MNCNLPPLKVFVNLEFITSNLTGSAKCHLISVRTLQNQAMQFSVLLEDGTLYTGLPLNALSWESVDTIKSLNYCQPWDCISSSSQVICFDTLRYMPVEVTSLNEKGVYLFTIDFVGNNDLSRNSEHWKQMHIVALDSGCIVAYPQYNLKFLDAGMCSEKSKAKYIHNEHIWISE